MSSSSQRTSAQLRWVSKPLKYLLCHGCIDYTLITTHWQPAASVLSYLDKYILFALVSVLLTSVWITIRMLAHPISDDDDDNSVSNTTKATTTILAEVTLAERIVWSVVASVNLLGHVLTSS